MGGGAAEGGVIIVAQVVGAVEVRGGMGMGRRRRMSGRKSGRRRR
jgi:hypothetical protein